MADAVGITPKFVPTDELRARDDSGGGKVFGWETYSAEFGDGPHTKGAKASLSAGKGGKRSRRKDSDGDNDGDED